jgi:FkbM family methyltransferase
MPPRTQIDICGLRELLNPTRLTRIVDIGANPINPTPYASLIRRQLACVWGFEPQRSAFEQLEKMQTPNMSFLPYAIGDGNVHELRVCNGSGFTSLLEPNRAFCNYMNHFHVKMTVKDRIRIETRRLDDITELPQVDLIKIDIQGGEVMVFENAAQTLSTAVAVITEVALIPLYEGQPLLDTQMRVMRENGFGFHKFAPAKAVPLRGPLQTILGDGEALRNQMTDADVVFLRDVSPATDLDTEALKHLAILAVGAFDSLDVCLRCLDILVARKAIDPAVVTKWVEALRTPHAKA